MKETMKALSEAPCGMQSSLPINASMEVSSAAVRRTPVDQWVASKLGIPISELSQEKLTDWQIGAFRQTMRYAKDNSRFYRTLFEGFEPEEIRSLKDIERLPLTSETDLADNELAFYCVNPKSIARVVSVETTGTTDRKKRLAFTDGDRRSAMAFIHVGFTTMCAPGDRMLVMMSGGTAGSIGDTVTHALAAAGIETKVYGMVGDLADAYECIRAYEPNVIVGYPIQSAAIAKYGARFGNPESRYIKSVLMSADALPEAVRKTLNEAWGCQVFNHYGMTEMCIAGGVECEGQNGFHTRDCDLLFEIIDPDENGMGEVVLTTLGREGMPLIRYRTGDIGCFTESHCPCGSPLRRIGHLRGRKSSRIDLATGKCIYLAEIAEVVLSDPDVIDFDCHLSAGGRIGLELKTLCKAEGAHTTDRKDVGRSEKATVAVTTVSAGLSMDLSCAGRVQGVAEVDAGLSGEGAHLMDAILRHPVLGEAALSGKHQISISYMHSEAFQAKEGKKRIRGAWP
jgi:phenylacetate-coenzyme A ligase PaaK-like adenylate-forming protein